jgi:hypothetical protein
MIDEHDSVTIVNSEEELNRETEWPYLDEIVQAFDGDAVPVELFLDGEIIRMRAAGTFPDFGSLTAAAERFFKAWRTTNLPTAISP